MLETIREFARARLQESGEADEIADRHAGWILGLAEQGDEEMEAAGNTLADERPDERWFDRLDEEYPNVRSALRFLLDRRDSARAARLGYAVRAYWLRRDRAPEGVRWMEEALARLGADDPIVEARALYALGMLAFFANQPDKAETAFERTLELGDRIEDPRLAAATYTGLGNVARARGDLREARRRYEQGRTLIQGLGDRSAVYHHLHLLGELVRDTGDISRGRELLTQALTEARALGQPGAEANTIHSLADLALDEGDLAGATRHYREALELFVELRSTRSVAYCFAGLACVAARERRCTRAGRLWGAVERIEESPGARMLEYERERYEREMEALAGEEFSAAVAAGRRLELEQAVDEALAGG
jgi:tetratricopeptide (TPR) repeat protein